MDLAELFQQYGPLFGILAAVATVLGVAFTIYKTAHDRQVKDLREQVAQKDHRIEVLEREGPEWATPRSSRGSPTSSKRSARRSSAARGLSTGRTPEP
jgi:hypothetical protein